MGQRSTCQKARTWSEPLEPAEGVVWAGGFPFSVQGGGCVTMETLEPCKGSHSAARCHTPLLTEHGRGSLVVPLEGQVPEEVGGYATPISQLVRRG